MKPLATVVLLLVGAGAGVGALALYQGGIPLSLGTDARAEREVLYYQHPHNPSIRSDEPRKDEMGMDYIPVYADADNDDVDPEIVRITPAVIQNMGVRTATVERGSLARGIRTVGFVEVDEATQSHVHLRTEGWIEDLQVRTTGERVEAGQVLFRLYSPVLVNAQEELLQIMRRGSDLNPARQRLRALGMDDSAIRTLEERGEVLQLVPVRAAQDGIVQSLNVAEGMYVQPGTEVMSIADLSRIWVIADLFEHQSDAVREGLAAEVHLPFRAGETLNGRVGYIYPTLASPTRTIRARLSFDNPDGRLKPGMWADVHIEGEATGDVTHVPAEAVIRTGHQDRVIAALGDGRFQAREVRMGRRIGDRMEVLEGLEEGDLIVTSGQFLIDSESSVTVELARMANAEHPSTDQVDGDEDVEAEGRINSVDRDARVVNLDHEPIPALGWPAMTMDFTVADGVSLEGLSKGDRVRIRIREREEYVFELTAIEPLGHDH